MTNLKVLVRARGRVIGFPRLVSPETGGVFGLRGPSSHTRTTTGAPAGYDPARRAHVTWVKQANLGSNADRLGDHDDVAQVAGAVPVLTRDEDEATRHFLAEQL